MPLSYGCDRDRKQRKSQTLTEILADYNDYDKIYLACRVNDDEYRRNDSDSCRDNNKTKDYRRESYLQS